MGIQFETEYSMETLTAMARGLRKTVRKKRSRRVHIFAAVVILLELFLLIATAVSGEPFGAGDVGTLIALGIVISASLFEDRMNAWIAKKNLLPGSELAVATFEEDGYLSVTGAAESKFFYAQILAIAETKRYFILLLSAKHAQAYDKTRISGGSEEDFRAFLAEKTGKTVEYIK